MTLQSKVTIGIVALAILVVGMVFPTSKPAVTQVIEKLGAVSTTDQTVDNYSYNGMRTWAVRKPLASATTTPCQLRAPNATTTLIFTSFTNTTATSSAGVLSLGTTTVTYATSSSLVAKTDIAANSLRHVVYRPTSGLNTSIIGPNQVISWGITSDSVAYGYTYTGSCEAMLVEY